MIFYLVVTLGDAVASTSIDPSSALYVSVLHFLLPFVIAFSISTNSPFSRLPILLYFLVLSGATVFGKGYLGSMAIDEALRIALAIGLFLAVCVYLCFSSKMRAYYALLRGDTIPMGTGDQAIELVQNPWPGKRGKAVLDWIVDHLEIIVILGLIASVILAWRSMKPS